MHADQLNLKACDITITKDLGDICSARFLIGFIQTHGHAFGIFTNDSFRAKIQRYLYRLFIDPQTQAVVSFLYSKDYLWTARCKAAEIVLGKSR